MAASQPALFNLQEFTDNGVTLVSGRLYTYAAGTTALRVAYADVAGTIPQTYTPDGFGGQYIALNARGELPTSLYLGPDNYDITLRRADGSTVWTRQASGTGNFEFKATSPDGANFIGNGGESVAASFNALQLSDYAALRAYTGPRKSVYITGYLMGAEPSGIAGWFVVDPNDTTSTDDGGTLILANNGKRWVRQYTRNINVDWFGAFGADDAQPAWQAAIACAERIGGGFLTARPGATYKMERGLRYNSCLVGAELNGATLDFSAMTWGIAFSPHQTGIEHNSRTGAAQIHHWADGTAVGPGYAIVGVVAVRIDQPDDFINAGNTFIRMRFQKFAVDVQLLDGSFFTTFDTCVFQGVPGAGLDSTYSIQLPIAFNAGEKNTFRDCLFGGRNYGIDQNNSNADTTFENCRFDFFGKAAMICSAGTVIITAPHIEIESDVAEWFLCSGHDTSMYFSDATLTIPKAKSAFPPFYSDTTCTNGGIVIKGLKTVFGATISVPLVGGAGRTDVHGIQWGRDSSKPLISAYQNLFTYGDFESANFAADWSLAGGGGIAPTRTAEVVPHSGQFCLKFQGQSGFSTSASATFPCRAGQYATLEYWCLALGMGSSNGKFFASMDYVDRAGNNLASAQLMLVTADIASWTRVNSSPATPAPRGTHYVRILLSMFDTVAGATPLGYVDDVALTIT